MLFNSFDKQQVDKYLGELAKRYRKVRDRSIEAEITLIGGTAILVGYNFRNSTTDIDALIRASSTMKESINYVADKNGLPNGWLNDDFIHTSSYTPKLEEYSIFYKDFYGVITVRVITAEYLVAMKLFSFREYKNDQSDIIGILAEHKKRNQPLSIENIDKAVKNLYGGWDKCAKGAKEFIENLISQDDLDLLYISTRESEKVIRESLSELDKKYPKTINERNIEDFLKSLKDKLKR